LQAKITRDRNVVAAIHDPVMCIDIQASRLILLPPSQIAGRYLREGFRSTTYDDITRSLGRMSER
jgi:hypothetical protein